MSRICLHFRANQGTAERYAPRGADGDDLVRARAAPTQAGESPLVSGGIVGFAEGAALYLVAQALVLLAKGHTEKVEEALYLIAFFVALPAAVWSALRWSRRLPGGSSRSSPSSTASACLSASWWRACRAARRPSSSPSAPGC